MQKTFKLMRSQRQLAEILNSYRRYALRIIQGTLVVGLLSLLSACVTENYRAGVRQDKAETQVNPSQAASVRVSLGLRYLQKGDFTQAKFNLSKALELAPDSAEANYAFAYYLQKTGETAQADRYYQIAIKLAPDNGDTRNNYGVFLCQQGKYEQAQQQFIYATGLKDYIRSASTYENLAVCAQAQQNISDALHYITLAEQHHASPSKILAFKAELHYQSGEFTDTLASLERLAVIQKPNADLLLLKHLAALAAEQVPLAYQAAQELVSRFPHSKEADWYKNDELFRCRFEQMRSEYQRIHGKKP